MQSYRNPFEGLNEPLPKKLAAAGFRQLFAQVADGVTLSYIKGPAQGPPLVLLPAQMGTWLSYANSAADLADGFEVYAVDITGHGASSWTPGNYSWDSVGAHLRSFLETVIGRPAIVSGNSSGGIFALWLAANAPASVSAIVLEDAPVFSVEWPRFRDRDRFVYNGLSHAVEVLGDPGHRRLVDYLGQDLPVSETRTKQLPDWALGLIDRAVARWEAAHPGRPSGIAAWWAPSSLHELFRSLSMFDPDFARAFVDGRFYSDFSHEAALRAVRVPILLMHGRWMRLERYGLVGALDDDDVRRVQAVAPQTVVRRFPKANHVIHRYERAGFAAAVRDFAATLPSG